MTIKAIETLRLGEFPNLTWVIVEDTDGVRGLGETYRGSAEVEAYVHDTAAPKLIGLDAVGVEPVRPLLRPYVGHQAAGRAANSSAAARAAVSSSTPITTRSGVGSGPSPSVSARTARSRR